MKTFTEQEHIDILADIIAMKSVNDGEHEVALYIKDLLGQYGIESEIIPVEENRSNLIASVGSGSPVIGLSGHMDVVSAGNEAAWTSDPFVLAERDGKLYGRGTNDMKAGLLNIVFAMIEMKENGLLEEGKGTIKFMATVGEEVGGAGARQLYEEGQMDDVDYLWVTEPSVDDIIFSHKGSMNYRVDSIGEAAHSSMPHLGHNAIDTLAEFIVAMNDKFRSNAPSNETLGEFVINATIIEGGQQTNSIPESAHIEINSRTIPEFDNQKVKDTFEELAAEFNKDGERIVVTNTMDLESVFTDGKSSFVEHMVEVGEKALGWELPIIGSPGVTDAANLLKDKDPSFGFAMFGPGETRMAHKVDEYVDKDIYVKFTKIIQEVCQLTFADAQ